MPLYFTGSTMTGSTGNDFLIGLQNGPNHTFNGGDGNDVIYADFGPFVSNQIGSTAATAYDLTSGSNLWTRQENRDIVNSTTVSHTTVMPTSLSGNQGWLSVTVVAGQQITLDVDYGRDTNNADTDTLLRLYQSDGSGGLTQLASNDDTTIATLDVGSTRTQDSFLQYTFATAGTYLINIIEFGSTDGNVFEANDEFMLHVSLTGQTFEGDPAPGDDILNGGNGDDVLYGFGGNDILNGGAGADVLNGGAEDFAYGDFASYSTATTGIYARLDGVAGSSGEAIGDVYIAIDGFIGSAFDDILVGDGAADDSAGNTIDGGAGNDQLYGLEGSDTLIGGAGADILNGGGNTDPDGGGDLASYETAASGVYVRLDGVAGATGDAIGDTFIDIEGLAGSLFNDILVGSLGKNLLSGNNGDDILYGLGGEDFLGGGDGNDNLYGGTGADVLRGGAGFDNARYDFATTGVYARLDGVAGSYGEATGDTFDGIEGFVGSAFDDIFVGSNGGTHGGVLSSGNEFLLGQGGNDYLYGLSGADNLQGGAGNDNLYGGTGADVLNGGANFDLARYDGAASGVYVRLDGVAGASGEAAGDTFVSIEGLVGSYYADVIVGSAVGDYLFGLGDIDYIYGQGGNDNIDGGAGNDQLYGGAGGDVINGGDGLDLSRYDNATSAVYTRLDGVAGQGGEAVGDTYVSIEGLVGSAFNDTFVGSNTSADYLYGLGGNDALYGLGGNDNLEGGAGNDTLSGGTGSDRFVFNTALGVLNVDTITDFQIIPDDIVLSQAIFAGIGATLDATEFQIGAANASTDRIIYDNVSGELYYDADGNGGAAAILFATVTAGTALTINDFIMVA